jgi:hypothetical protein
LCAIEWNRWCAVNLDPVKGKLFIIGIKTIAPVQDNTIAAHSHNVGARNRNGSLLRRR